MLIVFRIGLTLTVLAPNCLTISFIVKTAPATAFGCLLLRPSMHASKTVSALLSHSTMSRHSSTIAFLEPALDVPKMFFSTIADVKASLADDAAGLPPYSRKAHAQMIPCSCATAFASLRAPARMVGSRRYGLNSGASSAMLVLKVCWGEQTKQGRVSREHHSVCEG